MTMIIEAAARREPLLAQSLARRTPRAIARSMQRRSRDIHCSVGSPTEAQFASSEKGRQFFCNK